MGVRIRVIYESSYLNIISAIFFSKKRSCFAKNKSVGRTTCFPAAKTLNKPWCSSRPLFVLGFIRWRPSSKRSCAPKNGAEPERETVYALRLDMAVDQQV
ncbi:hypothetical protein HNR34_002428 [Geobacillus subterraneus]